MQVIDDHSLKSKQLLLRGTLVFVALTILLSVYLFQRFNAFYYFVTQLGSGPDNFHPYVAFIVNKSLRLVVNDLACVLLIFAIFREKKYLLIAFYVFLFEFFAILPLYFLVKLTTEGDSEISSPLLSQVHRMIVNPTLMILLMASFFYQHFKTTKRINTNV